MALAVLFNFENKVFFWFFEQAEFEWSLKAILNEVL